MSLNLNAMNGLLLSSKFVPLDMDNRTEGIIAFCLYVLERMRQLPMIQPSGERVTSEPESLSIEWFAERYNSVIMPKLGYEKNVAEFVYNVLEVNNCERIPRLAE